MAKGTCKVDECPTKVLARGLCSKHYARFRADGTLDVEADPSVFASYHRITEPNAETRAGTCSVCGPVPIRIRGGGRAPQCGTMRSRERGRNSPAWSPRTVLSGSDRRKMALWRYKLTDAQLDALVARAAGRCEICDTPVDFEEGDARVDHCHDTGLVRGLLCHACNIGIAWFKDDPQRALSAHFYLAGARADNA